MSPQSSGEPDDLGVSGLLDLPGILHVRREKPRILIVEDHKDMREALTKLFYLAGWDVVCARTLNEAYSSLATHYGVYDAALIDLMLPDTDIHAVPPVSSATLIADMRRLQAGQARPTRIIVCSACHRDGKMVADAMNAGADEAHFKPIDWTFCPPSLLGGPARNGLLDVVMGATGDRIPTPDCPGDHE